MKRKSKKKLTHLQESWLWRITVLLVAAVSLWLLFAPGTGVLSLFRQRAELQNLKVKNTELAQENKELQEEVERLLNDPAYLEEIARREYGLLKKNEYIYDFSPAAKNKR